jgi:acyl carrier protein
MDNQRQLGRSKIVALVLSSLQNIFLEREMPIPNPLDESITLIGPRSVLDSLGLVTLLIDLEQRLDDEHGLALTLADERALSQKNSPFRTVRSLTDYICGLIEEAQDHVAA